MIVCFAPADVWAAGAAEELQAAAVPMSPAMAAMLAARRAKRPGCVLVKIAIRENTSLVLPAAPLRRYCHCDCARRDEIGGLMTAPIFVPATAWYVLQIPA
jgi:hypothetical protein